jgi:hypothetical protein
MVFVSFEQNIKRKGLSLQLQSQSRVYTKSVKKQLPLSYKALLLKDASRLLGKAYLLKNQYLPDGGHFQDTM